MLVDFITFKLGYWILKLKLFFMFDLNIRVDKILSFGQPLFRNQNHRQILSPNSEFCLIKALNRFK